MSYDAASGTWDWGGFNWGQSIPAQANLIPLLIEAPGNTQASRLANFYASESLQALRLIE